MNRLFTLATFLFFIPLIGFAQQPAAGLPPFGSFDASAFDAINRQDLNVNLAIPVMSSPGRGGALAHSIVNNSLLWSMQGNVWSPVRDINGNPTWGWQVEPPLGRVFFDTYMNDICEVEGGFQYFATTYENYRYVDPSGTVHIFGLQFDDTATPCNFETQPRTATAIDGTGYYIDATVPYGPVVKDSAGRNVKTTGSVIDSNGNSITATVVSSTVTQWKDSAGHVALVVDKSTSPYTDLKYLDNTGAYQTIRVTMQSFNVKTNFACSGVVEYTGTASLPVSVTLPNGKQYQFTYEATPGFPTYVTARVKRVTLPTGGYYEYAYSGSNDGTYCSDGSVLNVSRTINDGTSFFVWQYTRTPPGSSWTTTVTPPQLSYDTAANQSVYAFDTNSHETSEKFYQGSAATGTLLRTINRTWAANSTPATQTTILENNQQTKVETDYDSNGNLTALREYDWGTGAPGSLVRNTTLTYLSTSAYTTRNILNRVTQQIVKDGAGTIKFRTDIAYDAGGVFSGANCITGAAQHDDTNYGCSFITRGNSTSITTYTDPVTPAGSITKSFTYDSLGNLRTAQLNCCQQKQFNYSSTTQYAYPDSAVRGTSPTQLTTSATYNSYTGLVATSTDENGKSTSFAFDTLKRMTSVTRPDSTQITYTYDDTARTTTVNTPTQGTDKLRSITYVDPLGRAYKQSSSDTSGGNCSAGQTQFDALGRAYKASNPYDCAGSPAYWTETRFDGLGRPTKTIPPDGSSSSNNTSFGYAGPSVTVTDPAGKQKKTQADGLGRLVTAYEPDVANGNQLTQQTTYTYNVFDGLTLVTQGSQTRTLVYDALGRLTDSTTPEAGHFQYQYNSFNLMTQRTDARGVITTYGYDTLNRPASVSYNVGSTGVPATATVSYTYGTSSASNNNGRLLTLTDGVGTETYSYDNLGRTTQLQKVISGTTYPSSYAYSLASELTTVTYPSGRVVQQSYDAIGRLCAIGNSGSTCSTGTTFASGLAYNKAGQVTSMNYGNGVAATMGYTPERLLLQTLSYTKGATTLLSLSYGYTQNGGNNGQITSISDSTGTQEAGRSVTYTYDALYRLTNAATTGSTNYPAWGLSETYDRYGNRSAQGTSSGCTGITCPTNSVTITAATNRISGSPYAYDANGNMTNDGANTLTYDAENHAVTAAGATYTYDGHGLRVKKLTGGTTTVYIFSGSKVLAEYVNGAAPASPTREYVYSGSQMLAKIEAGATNYYHSDHLSARIITDSTGTVVGQRAHFPYGETWYETGTTTTKIKFTSYERDSESGNDFAIARYHINRLGRFNSPDLLSGSTGNPQSLNRYAYVVDDPLNLLDPTGMVYGPCGPLDELCPPSPGGGRSGGGGAGVPGGVGVGHQLPSVNAPPVGVDDGGGGGGDSAQRIVIEDVRAALLESLLNDTNCINALNRNGGSALSTLKSASITSGFVSPNRGIQAKTSADSSGKSTVTINTMGSFFASNLEFQGGVLLHELGHLTNALLPDYFPGNPDAQHRAQDFNRVFLETNCSETISNILPSGTKPI